MPAASATCCAVSSGLAPRMARSSSSRSGSPASIVEGPWPLISFGRCPVCRSARDPSRAPLPGSVVVGAAVQLEDQVGDRPVDGLDLGNVGQLETGLLARVVDDQGAAAEDPVAEVLL